METIRFHSHYVIQALLGEEAAVSGSSRLRSTCQGCKEAKTIPAVKEKAAASTLQLYVATLTKDNCDG